ncbi:cytochrome c-type biogenesis protein CcmH [Paracoccus isoporae]|uniref:Cytochrome c-type biogenesis protein CcmH n=1 Tax=Paracoccus isoporae TaxID=591205 RepID=A0A1G6T6V8_9RHOB|nr:c-type cytochrome biogenesis protein CcmI [Paracoccus isoporae]SDD24286.1 cytochrome c-type biogenesis protein CcmH [Paracoccus isoporae]
MFWLLAAALTAIVALALARPFLRAGREGAEAEPAAAYDLRVYRDQLGDVDRDLQRGIIDPAEAERLKAEIGRKILDADRAIGREGAARRSLPARHGLAGLLALALCFGGAAALYWRMGTPAQPDMGLRGRLSAAAERYDTRPSQAEAESRAAAEREAAAARLQQNSDPQMLALIDELRAAVAQRPDDPQGLALLARNEARIGNAQAAAEAQRRLIALAGEDSTAQQHAFLAGVMTEAAGGLITPEAERELNRALERDPANEQARYMSGLLQAQTGRPDRAFPIWSELLRDGAPDSPWNMAIRPVIGDIAWLAGAPDYQPPPLPEPQAQPDMPALPGPDAEQIEAAGAMTPEERAAFIGNMVAQLESRLATQGGPAEEWARLISSLAVLGQTDRAATILAEARSRFADTPAALSLIDAAAADAGLPE